MNTLDNIHIPVSPDVYILSQRDLDGREQKAFKRGVTGGRVTAEGWAASRHRHDNQQSMPIRLTPKETKYGN